MTSLWAAIDRLLLRLAESYCGPRESWSWWQRAIDRGYLFKRGWL